MPVAGSTATASCENRPSPLSGTASLAPLWGTSKTYPWRTSDGMPALLICVVSSHVSHEPHGARPPAQLRIVPLRLGVVPSHSPRPWWNRRFVVPPAAVGSYVAPGANGVPLPRSWLRTRNVVPWSQNVAMPSCELGVGWPSSIRSPVQPYEMYE